MNRFGIVVAFHNLMYWRILMNILFKFILLQWKWSLSLPPHYLSVQLQPAKEGVVTNSRFSWEAFEVLPLHDKTRPD